MSTPTSKATTTPPTTIPTPLATATPPQTIRQANKHYEYVFPDDEMYVYDMDNGHQLIKQIGPLKNGVRPYTINKEETLAFTITSSFLGFEVSSMTTGKLLYSGPIQGFTAPAFMIVRKRDGLSRVEMVVSCTLGIREM